MLDTRMLGGGLKATAYGARLTAHGLKFLDAAYCSLNAVKLSTVLPPFEKGGRGGFLVTA